MKKMSEVFALPISGENYKLTSNEGHVLSGFNFKLEAQHAAHAINHVDELADVIENVLHHHGHALSCEIRSWCVDALDAYRGEK